MPDIVHVQPNGQGQEEGELHQRRTARPAAHRRDGPGHGSVGDIGAGRREEHPHHIADLSAVQELGGADHQEVERASDRDARFLGRAQHQTVGSVLQSDNQHPGPQLPRTGQPGGIESGP